VLFLKQARGGQWPELWGVSSGAEILYVKEDLIIPHVMSILIIYPCFIFLKKKDGNDIASSILVPLRTIGFL
jgi:hypothetical protein